MTIFRRTGSVLVQDVNRCLVISAFCFAYGEPFKA
jgi:hypothetical protein